MGSARYVVGDVFDVLETLEPNSVDLVFSSPPFLALRSYLPADHPDKGKEIGSEASPADFLDTLLDVVEACDRVLAPHGSLCFELGDTFAGSGGGGGDYLPGGLREGQPGFSGSAAREREIHHDECRIEYGECDCNYLFKRDGNAAHWRQKNQNRAAWPLDKSLCGIPTLFAWSLAYGRNLLRPERETPRWRIRNLVVWARPNPPVGALGDKFRPATSYVTVATKARDRYFDLDAVREPAKHPHVTHTMGRVADTRGEHGDPADKPMFNNPAGAPPLDYWVIPTHPYPGSHYATFPPELVVKPVKAMCPLRVCRVCGEPSRRITEPSAAYAQHLGRGFNDHEDDMGRGAEVLRGKDLTAERETIGWTDCGHGDWRTGILLDPFAGSGTSLSVATGHGRDAVGIDLDSRNAELALERVGPLMLSVEYLNSESVA